MVTPLFRLQTYIDAIKGRLAPGATVNVAGTANLRQRARQLSDTASTERSQLRHSSDLATGQPPDPGPLPPIVPQEGTWPIRYQFPYGWNQVYTPRSGTLTKFDTLRQFADLSDLVRIAIEARKDQLVSLEWDFVVKDPKKPNDAGVQTVKDFFAMPDRRRDFKTWLRAAIEEVLVIDALSIYRRPLRAWDPDRPGPVSPIYALEIKDGSTFKVLLDENGETPQPPDAAYRQIIWGHPVIGGDCDTRTLMYRPHTVRSSTPYGLSPTEAVLLTVNSALNRDMFNLAYYSDGNVPAALVDTPQGWTAQQIADYQAYFDLLMSGDLAAKRKMKFVANGTAQTLRMFAEPNWDTKFDEWLMKKVCASFAMPPSELGFTQDVNRATAKQQQSVVYRRGVRPLANFFKGIFDEVISDNLGLPDVECVFTHGEVEDRLKQAQADAVYVDMGALSVDEIRQRDGYDPVGLGPYVMTQGGPIFVEELITGVSEDPTVTEVGPEAGDILDGDAGVDYGDTKPVKPATGAEKVQQIHADLARWKATAIKAVKVGRPIRPFASVAIPGGTQRALRAALGAATTVEAVAKAFASVEKAQALTRRQARAQRTFQRRVSRVFVAQGKALADHLKTEIEARS